MSNAKRYEWLAEDLPGIGWVLNEFIPEGSDGFLADFGAAGETACKQAAHEHNCFPGLLAALERIVDCYDIGDCPRTSDLQAARAAIAKATGAA
jgi:hypothetical protein